MTSSGGPYATQVTTLYRREGLRTSHDFLVCTGCNFALFHKRQPSQLLGAAAADLTLGRAKRRLAKIRIDPAAAGQP